MKDYLKKYYVCEALAGKEHVSSKILMNDEDSDEEKER